MFPFRARTVAVLAVMIRLTAHGWAESVGFRNDVMAVLSKAGCNSGPCHGNASGKGGFKLSLRGEDPERDYEALTRDVFGRRINPNDPEESLLLLKPSTRLGHEGGQRFERGSIEYDILRRWIDAGSPPDPVELPRLVRLEVQPAEQVVLAPDREVRFRAQAFYSDGTSRDVTRLAVYEPTTTLVEIAPDGVARAHQSGEVTVLVRYLHEQVPARLTFVESRPEFVWPDLKPRNYVDEHVFAKLKTVRVRPSDEVDDALFIRRAHLDLLGLLPTTAEARRFVADPRPDKRVRVVDDLLERAEFAEWWALKWADLLRNEEKALDRKGVELFHRWIRDSIASRKPLDRFVRELIVARGSTYENPPANFYRGLRAANIRAETAAQVFLGTRLLCAQCHNHPFDRWTQADYYDWAGLFARVQYKVLENRYPDGLDKHGFTGEQIVFVAHTGEARNPNTGKDARPRFLGADVAVPEDIDRLEALAAWVTSPDNPRFARVQVNRIWYQLMGRGLVDPVDDFRATNPASHPALLDALAADFIEHDFDLRHVIRTIMASRTYQTASLPDETAVSDEINYSHNRVRRLEAEALLDAMSQVAGAPILFSGYPEGLRAGQIPGVPSVAVRRKKSTRGEQFLKVFGKPERLLPTEEERSCQTTLGQAFQLITGPAIAELLAREDNRIDRLAASGRPTEDVLDELYWTALTRPPTPAEQAAMVTHVKAAPTTRAGLEDVAWALMNAKEFVMRH